jgi:hypothetical protein
MVNSMKSMDETAANEGLGTIREGFVGQRMLVVPRTVVADALRHPLTGKMLVTDAGFFPHAARHGRTRPRGAGEHILLVCTDGTGWCRSEDFRFTVSRGGTVLLPADRTHAYGASEDDPWTLWWFHFIGTDAADLVRTAHSASGGPVTHLRDPAPAASLVSQVIDALDSGLTTSAFIRAAGAAWHALTQVIATGRREPGSGMSPFERAAEHLRSTAPQRTSVTALASRDVLAHFLLPSPPFTIRDGRRNDRSGRTAPSLRARASQGVPPERGVGIVDAARSVAQAVGDAEQVGQVPDDGEPHLGALQPGPGADAVR